jgi:uncharacterized secreted protein with C-terminal beta-propeller domain
MTSRRSIYRATVAFVFAALGVLQGCADQEDRINQGSAGSAGSIPPDAPGYSGDFVSDSPSSSNGGSQEFDGSNGQGGSGGSGAPSGAAGSGGQSKGEDKGKEGENDPKKTIEEADIVHLRGAKLYTLSRSSGLAIIDVSNPDDLKMLGRYPLSGQPFEMYVKENTILAMFSSWGHYECEGDNYESCKWVSSSHIAALDATDPANLELKGTFDLPGEISDSRIVGDVLYAVSYENGYCWGCTDKPNTTISSLSLKNLQSIKRVDKVTYENSNNGYGWSRRSISVNDKRIFVAGIEYDYQNWNSGHSTIQVVDISDPSGKMKLGAAVNAEGQIESRWQMDEYNGVLRVISQPGVWSMEQPPKVQTFQVDSSDKLTPLASVDIKLPMPERLRSVRFDGDRAFAITAVQTDPLFTFDLSDPAEPKQLGELEMPGWVYHMEPKGDRLLALGFDNQSKEGSLNVSLFDISDMTKPTMLERIHFGGSWGNFAEDQDRIHKAFTILDKEGLILVPFAGWEQQQGPGGEWWGCGSYKSGIQLVDYSKDKLVKRGVAPQKGQARRAFLKDDRLFSLSDDKLRTYDITDRDNPQMKDEVGLAHKVSRTMNVGNKLVRLAADWWTGEATLDVVPEADAESPEAPVSLDLSAYTGKDSSGCYGSNIYGAQMLSSGSMLTMIWTDYSYWYEGQYKEKFTTHVLNIDTSNPAAPKVLGHSELPFSSGYYGGYYGGYYDGYYGGYYGSGWLLEAGQDLVQVGTTVAMRRWVYPENYNYNNPPKQVIELIDLKDPSKPTHAKTIELPEGEHQTGLSVSGSWLVTSHAEPVPDKPGKVRFYLDRFDVSNPTAPVALPKVNVPGSPLRFDAATGSLVSVDYKKTAFPAQSWEECYGKDAYYYGGYGKWFDHQSNQCVTVTKSLRLSSIKDDKATLLDTLPLDTDGSWTQQVVFGQDHLFGMAYAYDPKTGINTQRIVTIAGLTTGKFKPSDLLLETGKSWYYGSYGLLGTSGDSAVLMSWSNENTIFTLDPTTQGEEKLANRGSLRSWASEVRIAGDKVIASLQDRGVQVVPLKLSPSSPSGAYPHPPCPAASPPSPCSPGPPAAEAARIPPPARSPAPTRVRAVASGERPVPPAVARVVCPEPPNKAAPRAEAKERPGKAAPQVSGAPVRAAPAEQGPAEQGPAGLGGAVVSRP